MILYMNHVKQDKTDPPTHSSDNYVVLCVSSVNKVLFEAPLVVGPLGSRAAWSGFGFGWL